MDFGSNHLLQWFKHFRLEEGFNLFMLHACSLVQKLLSQLPINVPNVCALKFLQMHFKVLII
jgi:hypothetical protein